MRQTGKILVTEYHGKILVCHFIGNKAERVFLEDAASADLPVGTVVIGKVRKVIRGIGAAFVSLGTDKEYFMTLPAEHDDSVLLVNRPYDGNIRGGDEIVVQIKKQAVKMKQPVVDCHISFAGRYAVIQTGRRGFHISARLTKAQKDAFRALQGEFSCDDEIIIRTNAAAVSGDDVRKDIEELKRQREHIKDVYQYRTCYSVLQQALPAYLTMIRDIPADAYEEIVTDDPKLSDVIAALADARVLNIRLYEDASYPLIKLYSLETVIKELSDRKVWLKSGGFLIFDQTETLTAIDVNTGKNDKKADLAFAVDMEAVPEIGRQLRARNISGMILIDFINLEHKDQTDMLAEALREELKKDFVKADLIDITGLGLFEVTREKRFASLKELLH